MSKSKNFEVAIIGGGIAGLTLAIALHHRQVPVTIYEQAPQFGEIGAGVSFSPNALQAMKVCHEGVYDAFEKICTRNLWPSKQKVWFDYLNGLEDSSEGSKAAPEIAFSIKTSIGQNGVHRARYLDEMVHLVPKEIARFGKRLKDIQEDNGHGRLVMRFEDGTSAEADAVIGCDGIKSTVRKIIVGRDHPSAHPVYTHKYAYRGLVPMDKAIEAVGEELAQNSCMHMGPDGHVLTFPVNHGQTLNIVAFRTSPEEWPDFNKLTRPAKREDALRDFTGYGSKVINLLKLTKPDLDVWAIFDLGEHPVSTMYKGRICISGDAAHATSPHHGAGAGLCIEDSAVLAELLADQHVQEPQHLEAVFATFDAERRERGNWLVQASRHIGDCYEWRAKGVGRDFAKIEAEINRQNGIIGEVDVAKITTLGRPYRPSKLLPFELAQHVQTYYEEQLFTQAYTFLLSIIGNSASYSDPLAPVIIPSAPHLAVAATISIHPVFTTRTHSREKWDQANAALRLLRLVQTLVGPLNADFTTAFTFRKYDFNFRSSRHSTAAVHFDDEEDYQSDNLSIASTDLNTPYAALQSIFTRAEDFWHLVGWSFNCACQPLSPIHTARWHHYRLLLTFLLDVLEADWALRTTESGPDSNSTTPEESLLWSYIELASGGHARARRMLRAIFADGSTRSTAEFQPIFTHELKEPPSQNPTTNKRQVDVNIDADIYGDYLMRDESDLSDDGDGDGASTSGRPAKRLRTRTRTPSSRRVTPRSSNGSMRSEHHEGDDGGHVPTSSSTAALGDPACLALRLRLMRLLTYVSSHPTLTATSPTTFPDTEELITLFVEFIKPLPFPTFSAIISTAPVPSLAVPAASPHHVHMPASDRDPSVQHQGRFGFGFGFGFDPQTQTLLCESLLQRILENSAPAIRSNVLLSQAKLEEEYLPFAAGKNSIDANARVSVLLEALTRCLAQLGVLKRTDTLKVAVDRGIEKRTSKVGGHAKRATKKGGGTGDGETWYWLVESGERMQRIVHGLDTV
ncbi:hypothetical protein LTR99_001869 [Exophiala xenobiotica]|uniref:FAD-binding domain-containing protein n=1 Tax=Vermiconidia calcicola TaxID=1690605 RepID=A0AAV9Q6V0_9PEZI|nr:hypothetical protein LTR99_001869 [Exophiala xenobiotica]KAK5341841.1 hypothetical protein LTR98_002635 [Exophiala xenobiotica]KAK5531086.1 hypothetical protein LTR23_010132 [Chaetothyriales sp. CCFEE 6169]KAK5536637.1 hypothetical protein LTR25_005311 [Vermiconidia calcicola]